MLSASSRSAELQGRLGRQRRRLLPADATTAGRVAAVGLVEPVGGQAAEPGVIRHRPIPQVFVQPPGGVDQGFLDDVRWVHAGGQTAVEANGDHAAKLVPVAGEQLIAGGVVAGGGAGEQVVGVWAGGRPLACPPKTHLPSERRVFQDFLRSDRNCIRFAAQRTTGFHRLAPPRGQTKAGHSRTLASGAGDIRLAFMAATELLPSMWLRSTTSAR